MLSCAFRYGHVAGLALDLLEIDLRQSTRVDFAQRQSFCETIFSQRRKRPRRLALAGCALTAVPDSTHRFSLTGFAWLLTQIQTRRRKEQVRGTLSESN